MQHRASVLHRMTLFAVFTCSIATVIGSSSGCSLHKVDVQTQIAAADATTRWLNERYGFVYVPAVSQMVSRVVARLARAASNPHYIANGLDFEKYPWHVLVIADDEPNAFSVGSGTIFVTRGLIRELPSEGAFAAVLGHEMAHQILGHPIEALAEASVQNAASPVMQYSLDKELAADLLSLRILLAAQYDLRDSLQALKIGYRHVNDPVSGGNGAWLAVRAAQLDQAIAGAGDFLPATHNSREFSKAQAAL